jgi:hypothetical protein
LIDGNTAKNSEKNMIDVTSLYLGDCYVKYYEFNEANRQISIQVNALFIIEPGAFYNPGVDRPIEDAVIQFSGVSEYRQKPDDKKSDDCNDYIEFSVESGRFVIDCGIVDEDVHTENIHISFLAENVEII